MRMELVIQSYLTPFEVLPLPVHAFTALVEYFGEVLILIDFYGKRTGGT